MRSLPRTFSYALLASTVLCGAVWANPLGEQVVAGQVDFDRQGSLLEVNQQSQNAIVNWQSFGIAAGETTRFNQPGAGSAILNRVTGGDLSAIYGTLSSNGQVFLINPNGVVVGAGGVIDTGSFTASTLDIDNAAFLAGGDLTLTGASTAAIKNLGTIEAATGDVVLVGREIINEGVLKADKGTVALAAGSEVTLHPAGSSKVSILAGSAAGTLEHSGLIEAANAELRANGGNAGALAINSSGLVRATGLTEVDGKIILSGGAGDVEVGGKLEATRQGDGGRVEVTGERILVKDGAEISADGDNGGQVFIGGGREGKDASIQNAARVYVAQDAVISSNGADGNGGEVVLFSKDGTQSYGSLLARGSRNGGFIETSGGWLDLGVKVPDVSGGLAGGTWLIDPYNITIVAGSGNSNIGSSTPFSSSGDDSQLGVGLITSALGSGNVVITTGSGGSQAGDITLNTDLNFNGIGSTRTLTFNAHRNVTLNNRIYDSSAGGEALNVVLNADSDNNGLGAAIIKANITTGGGNLTSNRATYMAGGSALAINTGSGNQTYSGQVQMANSNGITLTTDGGTILFSGALDSGNTYAHDATTRTWSNARNAVKTGTGAANGDTYLVTITSALENSIAQSTLPASSEAWIGASDAAADGQWRWVTGPEGLESSGAGRLFWQGAAGGSAVSGQYNNWNSGEPNGVGGGEDFGQLGFGAAGEWNDLGTASTIGSIIETNMAPTNLTVNVGTGGVVTFNGAVGADKQLGDVTINSGGTVNFNNNFTSAGTVDTYSNAVFGTSDRWLTANSLIFRGTASGNVNQYWVADDMDIQGAVNFAGRTLALRQRNNSTAVQLGVNGDGTASTLELSLAELGRFTANILRIGNTSGGNLSLHDDLTLTTVDNLSLLSNGTISDGTGNNLTVGGLALTANGTITFDNGHDVDTFALSNSSANTTFVDSDGFNIGSIDGVNGIYAAGRNVALTAGGAVTQSQAVTIGGLELLGANGEWTLTNTSNNTGILAGNTKSVNYVDSNALSIGTVNTTGLTTTGATQVRTTSGNLTVDQNVVAGGGGNSLVLAAGAAFDNNRGAGALNAGTGGQYLVYTSTIGATDLDGLTPARQYNKTFGGNAPGTIGGTGSQVLYSYAPILTFTATTANHVYGNPNYTYSLSGLETGDSAATAFSGAPTFTPASTNVGTHTLAIDGTGMTNLQGYTFNFVNDQVTITPAPLTITADDLSREFAHENPLLTASYVGLTNGDTAAAITGVTLATAATKESDAGAYAIALSGGTNSNYTITRKDGTLTVRPFEKANEVKEQLTTFANVPTKQNQVMPTPPAPQVEPGAGPAADSNGGTQTAGQASGQAAPAQRSFVSPQVGVLPPANGSGQTQVEGGGGDALAQSSSLDLIEEETE